MGDSFFRKNTLNRYKTQKNEELQLTDSDRLLNQYLSKSSIEEEDLNKQNNKEKIKDINNKLKRLDININELNKKQLSVIDTMIYLCNNNATTKKQFQAKIKLDNITKEIENVVKEKKKLLIFKKKLYK
jgi:hypothetical protein